MASWIARHQGLGAWASMPTHPALAARAARALGAGEDLQTRRATGLASNAATGSAKAAAATQGHIRADVHIHGPAHKATVKTRGSIEAKLHRWPQMQDYA